MGRTESTRKRGLRPLVIPPLIDLAFTRTDSLNQSRSVTTSPGQWSSRITVGQDDRRRHGRSDVGSQYVVSVVNEIWHRKLGAVGKLFVGRKSRSDPLAKLNLRLTFIPITGKRW